jgi:hypothetical protein
MTELEQALVALGHELDVPPAPNLAPRVHSRLEPRRLWPRRVALAVAVVALAVGVAFAIPPARSAILRFFHLGGVTIERVDTLPHADERPLTADLGLPLRLGRAVRVAGFRPLLPRGLHPRLYAWNDAISMLVRVGHKPVLISETSRGGLRFEKKYVAAETRVVPVTVAGEPGYWITGARHVVEFQSGEPRLAGNVLLFLRHDLTVRIEGELSRLQALDLARSLR